VLRNLPPESRPARWRTAPSKAAGKLLLIH
jgi:hypothetical protein